MSAAVHVEGGQVVVQPVLGEVEREENDDGEGDEVEEQGESMVESVPGGEGLAVLELVEHEVHPPLPLSVLALLIAVLELGPDVVEVVEELPGGGAAPVDGHGEQADEAEGKDDQQVVEPGVGGGEHLGPAQPGLVPVVQRAVRIRVPAVTVARCGHTS